MLKALAELVKDGLLPLEDGFFYPLHLFCKGEAMKNITFVNGKPRLDYNKVKRKA